MIDPGASLGLLVARQPARAELFERLRFDYRCGGSQTSAQACARRGLDAETVGRILEALEDSSLDRLHVERNHWRRVSIDELCEHIVAAHHDKLRAELPRIEGLLATVVRVHGGASRAARPAAAVRDDPPRAGAAPGDRGADAVPGLSRGRGGWHARR